MASGLRSAALLVVDSALSFLGFLLLLDFFSRLFFDSETATVSIDCYCNFIFLDTRAPSKSKDPSLQTPRVSSLCGPFHRRLRTAARDNGRQTHASVPSIAICKNAAHCNHGSHTHHRSCCFCYGSHGCWWTSPAPGAKQKKTKAKATDVGGRPTQQLRAHVPVRRDPVFLSTWRSRNNLYLALCRLRHCTLRPIFGFRSHTAAQPPEVFRLAGFWNYCGKRKILQSIQICLFTKWIAFEF